MKIFEVSKMAPRRGRMLRFDFIAARWRASLERFNIADGLEITYSWSEEYTV